MFQDKASIFNFPTYRQAKMSLNNNKTSDTVVVVHNKWPDLQENLRKKKRQVCVDSADAKIRVVFATEPYIHVIILFHKPPGCAEKA